MKYEPCLFTGFLKTEPDGTLEAIAAQYNTTLLEVVKNLPSPTLVSGDQFDTVWETVSEWGKVTTTGPYC